MLFGNEFRITHAYSALYLIKFIQWTWRNFTVCIQLEIILSVVVQGLILELVEIWPNMHCVLKRENLQDHFPRKKKHRKIEKIPVYRSTKVKKLFNVLHYDWTSPFLLGYMFWYVFFHNICVLFQALIIIKTYVTWDHSRSEELWHFALCFKMTPASPCFLLKPTAVYCISERRQNE